MDDPFPEPVRVPIEDWLDLHTFSPRETKTLLEAYIPEAHKAGFRELRIVHGKGIGVQREIVRTLLSKHPLVAHFHDASRAAGGPGATIAYLKEMAD